MIAPVLKTGRPSRVSGVRIPPSPPDVSVRWTMINNKQLENLIFQKGSKLLKHSQKQKSAFFKKNWWYKKILAWTMSDARLKTSLFRFIDVLPSLSDETQFLSHFKEYFKGQEIGPITSGLGRLAPSLMVKNVKKQIQQVAQMFITGSNIEQVLNIISKNWENNLAFSVDILGEATLSEKEAEDYFKQYIGLMDCLVSDRKYWPKKKILQQDSFGPIPSVNISIKVSSLFSQIKTEAWEYSKEKIKSKLRFLFQKAVKDFVFINLDMEQYHYKDLFLEIFKELVMEEGLKDYPHFGIVIQTYLKDSLKDLQELSQWAEQREQIITVRLVKGAYWDTEVLLAKQKNWPIPVYTNKWETDMNFEACIQWLFENSSGIKLAVGSHNARSIACALAWHQLKPKVQLEFQVLYGIGEVLGWFLKEQGYCVRFYCTIGELIPGMSYLVRRLLENSANQSFILNTFTQNKSPEELLAAPQAHLETHQSFSPKTALERHNISTQKTEELFVNHPLLDFSRKDNRENFIKALADWEKKFPVEVPLLLEGEEIKTSEVFKRENPSQISQVISHSFLAGKELTERVVQSTSSFFEQWRHSPAQHRISNLKKLAELIKQKEFVLSALQVFEVGKTWAEAQADVAEAIDFCNYYALSYEQLIQAKKTDETAGEENFSHFEAIGPTAVIAPWNFPLAILTGMTVAPLLCGNTVVIKPAEQSPLTAFQLAQLLLDSGFPKQSFAFLPGKGSETGQYLVQHPGISIISFTGSFEVGSQIIKTAGQIAKDQKDIKKCVVEMGGKNAIVIDSSADLNEAIRGVLISAFGFQGQKCSACSRVIVLEDIYNSFIQRFLPAVQSLVTGHPKKPSTSLGPLIDEYSFQKIKKFIQKEQSQKLFEGSAEAGHAWFCPPLVYLVQEDRSPLFQEELFAPVLTVFKAKDIEEAIRQTNNIRFGLTAGFYSRHPGHIEKFKSMVEVGNLYINRNCTGAMVHRHPFGGRKMSGLGSKAGGSEYLKQFGHIKVISENSMRKGFAPELFENDFLKN